MKTKFLLLLTWALPLFLNAQITMTQGDFPSIGDVLVDAVDTLADTLDVGMPGPNQSWDFSDLQEGLVAVTAVIDPDTTALAADFPDANVAFETEGFVSYGNISSDKIIVLGSAVDLMMGMGLMPSYFEPHSKLYELPVQFGDSFTDDYAIQFTLAGTPPFADSIRNTQTTHRDVVVESWGQVTTPVGTYNALRTMSNDRTVNTTEVLAGGVWSVLFQDTTRTTGYEWLAKETKGPVVAAEFDEMGALLSVSYSKLSGGAAPVAAFSQDEVSAGVYQFTDLSTNGPTSWLWDFGDGSTSTQQNPLHDFGAPGNYTVCLIASNGVGQDTVCKEINIAFQPVASFTYMDQGNGAVQFTDESTNAPDLWFWDFGDGNLSVEQNPMHTFTASGDYNVCLIVSNLAGADTICQTITISLGAGPVAAFSFTDDLMGTLGFMDMTTNNPNSWSWDFGDGNTSTDQNPTHTYAASGAYVVCLIVANAEGMDTVCQNISVNFLPIAAFSFTDDLMGTFSFMDLTQNNPTSWSWDFGDGNTSTDQNPTHTFTASSDYEVCLIASNMAGSDTTCQTVTISLGTGPIAIFSFTDDLLGTLSFTDLSQNNPTSWFWDFGDGSTSNDQHPVHTYAAPGDYIVCLTVGNAAGMMDTVCQSISINFLPIAAFSFTDDMMGTFSFMDLTQNGPTFWLWVFGDGNTSTEQHPVHTYTMPGDYEVCLMAGNAAGIDTVCQIISFNFLPIAAFSFTDDLLGTLNFTDLSQNSPTSWFWDFGDSETSTEQHPMHTYSTPGDYEVCLMVGNAAGMDTVCQTITVGFRPIAAFSFTDDMMGTLTFTDESTNNPTSWFWDFGDSETSDEQNPVHNYVTPNLYNVCLTAINDVGEDTACEEINLMFTAVSAAFAHLNLEVYPNPTNASVRFKLGAIPEPFDLVIRNAVGQKVYQNTLENSRTVNVENWSGGIYLYQLNTKEGALVANGKVVVLD